MNKVLKRMLNFLILILTFYLFRIACSSLFLSFLSFSSLIWIFAEPACVVHRLFSRAGDSFDTGRITTCLFYLLIEHQLVAWLHVLRCLHFSPVCFNFGGPLGVVWGGGALWRGGGGNVCQKPPVSPVQCGCDFFSTYF